MMHYKDSPRFFARWQTPFIVVLTYLVGFGVIAAVTLAVILSSTDTSGLTQAGAILLLAAGGAVVGMTLLKMFFPESAEYDLLRRNADVAVTVDAARGAAPVGAAAAPGATPTAVATSAMQHAIKYQRAAHVKVISAIFEPLIILLAAIGGVIGLMRNDFVSGQATVVVLGSIAGGLMLMEMYLVSQTRLSPFMARSYWSSLHLARQKAGGENVNAPAAGGWNERPATAAV